VLQAIAETKNFHGSRDVPVPVRCSRMCRTLNSALITLFAVDLCPRKRAGRKWSRSVPRAHGVKVHASAWESRGQAHLEDGQPRFDSLTGVGIKVCNKREQDHILQTLLALCRDPESATQGKHCPSASACADGYAKTCQ